MVIFKKQYFLIIENTRDINLSNIKKKNKFTIIYRYHKSDEKFSHLLKFKYNISTFQIFENWIDLGQDKKNLKTSYR